jgi:hypothetical protein
LNIKNKIIAKVNKSRTAIPQKQTAALLGKKNRVFDGTSSLNSMFRNSVNKHHVVPNNTGCFIMFSVITNIYNKKTKVPTLMELFTTTGKLKKIF